MDKFALARRRLGEGERFAGTRMNPVVNIRSFYPFEAVPFQVFTTDYEGNS